MTIETAAATTGEWAQAHNPVVVAVDGSDRNHSAVDWAAHEAAALGCSVDLVTALHDHVVAPPGAARGRERETLDMLADVRSRVRHLVSEQQVGTHAIEGGPVEVLLRYAESARLVVVGRRDLDGLPRVLAGSTSVALAGRSPVPVAVVPDGWRQADHDGRPVVLGIDPSKLDHLPVHVAFARARRLGVTLVVVHGRDRLTTHGPSTHGPSTPLPSPDTDASDRASQDGLDAALAAWRDHFPDVAVQSLHAHERPVHALLEAAELAQLVVLGRHRTGLLGGFALGSVTRAVLHEARTPVLVVPAITRAEPVPAR